MLTSGDLSFMQDSIEQLFPDTCSVLSKTETMDSSGGYAATWGTASTVMCRMDFTNGVKQLSGAGLQPFSQMILSVPYDTTVTTNNRIEWGGAQYSISSVNDNSWKVCKTLEVHAL